MPKISEHDKNENYYGSPLNKFIDERCSHKMTCINIDCFLLKRIKKKIKIIESKHSMESMGRAQREALSRLSDLLKKGSKESHWEADIYLVKGNPPYEYVEIRDWSSTNSFYKLTQENFIKWLNFEKTLDELPNESLNEQELPVEEDALPLVSFMRRDS